MDKMRMESPDITEENIKKIGALFPNCITETVDKDGKPKKAINFDILRQMLSPDVVEGDEAYEFTWVGKKAAMVEAHRPIRKTLRPCVEESVDWDKTENLYIEGDNLDVLKLLQESYLGAIKMIYIDPPYNTGHDFVYPDSFIMDNEEYNEGTGYFDEDGNVNFDRENGANAGKYHSDWCSMIYSRLILARNLLSDDGVIFISIDDNEQGNLKKICDEVFDESNFVNNFMWLHGKGKKTAQSRTLQQYILCYAKNSDSLPAWIEKSYTNYEFTNPDNDPKGKWFSGSISFSESRSNPLHENYYEIHSPSGVKWLRQWQVTEEEMRDLLASGDIYFGEAPEFNSIPRRKIRPSIIDVIPKNILDDCGTTKSAEQELTNLLSIPTFDYPKPYQLLKHIMSIIGDDSSLILDFFSGSSTTAHAVMQLNAEDGGHRKFIMVQLPEPTAEDSEASKAGYKNICEIGKERIRRAGAKIKEENKDKEGIENLDTGFRVLKLDSTNMRDVYYSAEEYTQDMLAGLESNIKDDRSSLDLFFGCLLEWGLPLSLPYTSEILDGCTFYSFRKKQLFGFITCYFSNNLIFN